MDILTEHVMEMSCKAIFCVFTRNVLVIAATASSRQASFYLQSTKLSQNPWTRTCTRTLLWNEVRDHIGMCIVFQRQVRIVGHNKVIRRWPLILRLWQMLRWLRLLIILRSLRLLRECTTTVLRVHLLTEGCCVAEWLWKTFTTRQRSIDHFLAQSFSTGTVRHATTDDFMKLRVLYNIRKLCTNQTSSAE